MIRVFPDAEALSRAAAALFARAAQRAARLAGRFVVALAGGQTPRRAYEWLTRPECREAVPWEAVHVFWGDERCVPFEDPRSNAWLAHEALLQHVPIPSHQIHPIRCEGDPEEAAVRYEALLRAFFREAPPRFDLILLGLGEDGHTASLFPFHPAVTEQRRWVAAVLEADPPRVTLTLSILNQARRVVFLVTGARKAEILRAVWEGPFDPLRWPAQGVRPGPGRILWMVDAEAAAGLSQIW